MKKFKVGDMVLVNISIMRKRILGKILIVKQHYYLVQFKNPDMGWHMEYNDGYSYWHATEDIISLYEPPKIKQYGIVAFCKKYYK